MGAPKGNQFWKIRSKHGRDKLFKTPQLLLEAATEYFQWCDDNPFEEEDFIKGGPDAGSKVRLNRIRPYTQQGFALYCGASTAWIHNFRAALKSKDDKESKEFLYILTRIEEVIYNQKYSGAASGFFNHNIIARDLGLVDKKEYDATIDDRRKTINELFPTLDEINKKINGETRAGNK